MKIAMIIVAGGKGSRMQADRPKQFLELYDKPIIMQTLANVSRQMRSDDQVILVVPSNDMDFVGRILRHYFMRNPRYPEVVVAEGGATRAESVMHGISQVREDADYIGVHDGVRPFVNKTLFSRLELALRSGYGSVLPALPSIDSIRYDNGGRLEILPRLHVYRIQTPQIFKASLLREAYEKYVILPNQNLTDDASVVSEMMGVEPLIVEGIEENIKITTQMDLRVAEAIIDKFDAAL